MTISETLRTQHDKALSFHAMHRADRPLALANAWDAATARIVAASGAPAIATTSAGVAWALGAQDGGTLGSSLAVELTARVVAAVDLPVTADIENGFADSAAGVGETVAAVLAVGAVGVNLEDGTRSTTGGSPLLPVDEQAERLAAARAAANTAGIPLYLNARIDTYLRGVGEDAAARRQETLDRAAAYVAAGASGVFVPGVTDLAELSELLKGVSVPLNVLVGAGAPTVAELGSIGVARVSLGAAVAESAYAVVRRAAQELYTQGSYDAVADAIPYPELNALLGD
ncbi:isocitrate lyase/phosphoenolpyruvate mutase family protein [Kitasatospora acidiphila]|uniref:Isocitrate lyase/phosphoenolpyruvate mutase family protein n=1 Tax=Kitasatospora acidiphila TaxID=2567942 RepID=A0A540W6D1_9ACTN|nr:isocitrate lyase/phosphoenolpyruvate mutase family protein [Kitasatospora acidiphila]TQF04543.1 isocitrate lyase/phosphoenolpyruvate mutase family protein [Kitasatospora acidiphila]